MHRYRYVFELPGKLRESSSSDLSIAPVPGNEMDVVDTGDKEIDHFDASQGETMGIVSDFRKARDWIAAQVDSPAVRRIIAEINHAATDFKAAVAKKLEDPKVRRVELEQGLLVLNEIDPSEDHGIKILMARQEKAIEGLRRIRGAGAADAVLRQRMNSVVTDPVEHMEAMRAAEKIACKLCNAAIEGLKLFWQLGSIFTSGPMAEKRYDSVHLLMTEIVSEYSEGIRASLLPQRFTGAPLVSREAALATMQVHWTMERLRIPATQLGMLCAVASEVTETYVRHALRGMTNVARELAGRPAEDTATIPEQITLVVSETLSSLEGLVSPDSPSVGSVREACIQLPAAAARSMWLALFGTSDVCRGHLEYGASSARKIAIMASCCYFLRTQVIPGVRDLIVEHLGSEDLSSLMEQSARSVREEELAAVEKFCHFAAPEAVSRIINGVLCGGVMIGQVREPRTYCIQLVSELSEQASFLQSMRIPAAVSNLVLSQLVDCIASVFRSCVREMEGLSSRGAEQILLEIEVVERLVGIDQKKENKSPFLGVKKYMREIIGRRDFNAASHSAVLESALQNYSFFAGCFAE